MSNPPKIIKNPGPSVARPDTASNIGAPPRKLIDAEVYDARRERDEILKAANAHAQAIVAKAEAERDRIQAEAAEVGRQQGLASVTELVAKASLMQERKI